MSRKKTIEEILEDPTLQEWLEKGTREMDTDGSLRYLYDARVCMERRMDFLRRQETGDIPNEIYEISEYMSLSSCKIEADGVEYPSIIDYANSRDEWTTPYRIRSAEKIRRSIVYGEPFGKTIFRDARVFTGGFSNRYRSPGEEKLSVSEKTGMRQSKSFKAWRRDLPDSITTWNSMAAFSRFLGQHDKYVTNACSYGGEIASSDGVIYEITEPAFAPAEIQVGTPVIEIIDQNGKATPFYKKKDAAKFIECDPAQISRALKNGNLVKGYAIKAL